MPTQTLALLKGAWTVRAGTLEPAYLQRVFPDRLSQMQWGYRVIRAGSAGSRNRGWSGTRSSANGIHTCPTCQSGHPGSISHRGKEEGRSAKNLSQSCQRKEGSKGWRIRS
jgi:hypothetical protein